MQEVYGASGHFKEAESQTSKNTSGDVKVTEVSVIDKLEEFHTAKEMLERVGEGHTKQLRCVIVYQILLGYFDKVGCMLCICWVHCNPLQVGRLQLNFLFVRATTRKFTADNKCSIEFDPYGFNVRDYRTRQTLLCCDSTGDLYPLHVPPYFSPYLPITIPFGINVLATLVTLKADSSLFIFHKGPDTTYLLLYVDNIILTASSTSLLQRIISLLHANFVMTDLGPLNYFLGISATRTISGIFLSQTKYAAEIFEQAHMLNCNLYRTPIETEKKLGHEGSPITDPTLYHTLAESLQYLIFTRPDLSFPVQQLCLYMHDPREPHLNAMKRVLRYLRGTTDLGLQLFRSTISHLVTYSDADLAGSEMSWNRNLLRELHTPLFTATLVYCDNVSAVYIVEAEYRGVANVVAETSWIRNLLRELHTPLFTATLVYCDNVSAVYMSANPVHHQRTKHLEIDIHFVRDKVAACHVRVLHVPS
nr:hypothetical protein [Tanacetum cinerariifolium]